MSDRHQIIKVTEEYAGLIPKQSPQEYESLKQSISDNGLHMPVIVNQEGVLLDGHHRYRACQELNIKPHIEVRRFSDSIYEKLFIVHVNLKRRQLADAQKVELAYALKPVYEELARRNSLSNLRQNIDNNNKKNNNEDQRGSRPIGSFEPVGRVSEVVAKEVGLSRATYQRGETVLRQAPWVWEEQVKAGKVPISKAYNIHKRNLKREELLKSAGADSKLPGSIRLLQGDFIQKSTKEFLADNSVDLIFTDPPYGKKWLSLYIDLAKVTSRALKAGGSLITNVGHCMIPDVIHYMENEGLKYWWPIAVKLSGPFSRSYDKGVSIKWKPLLWFVKGEKKNAMDYISDYIESEAPEKALHEWEQSSLEAEHMIARLTVEKQIVFDPMMGSGTTGVAALKLNRKFIGIELDKEKFEVASTRISNVIKT
jgi:DNA modification methylase